MIYFLRSKFPWMKPKPVRIFGPKKKKNDHRSEPVDTVKRLNMSIGFIVIDG